MRIIDQYNEYLKRMEKDPVVKDAGWQKNSVPISYEEFERAIKEGEIREKEMKKLMGDLYEYTGEV